MMNLRSLKFKHKLILSYGLVILIPLMVLGVYFYMQSRTLLMQKTKMVLDQNTNGFADNINYKLEKLNSVMEFLSYNPSIHQVFNTSYSDMYKLYEDLNQSIDPLLNNSMFLNEGIKKIMIFTDNKTITKRIDSIGSINDIRNKSWFKEIRKVWKTKWYIYDGKIFGVHDLMKLPYEDFINIVYMELDPKQLFSNLDRQLLDKQIFLIYDDKGNAIYTNAKITDKKLKESIHLHGDKVILNGIQYMLIKKDILNSSWTLCCYFPLDSISVDAKQIILATTILIAICLMILVIIVWMFSNSFVKRINNLNNKMKLVAKGDLKANIPFSLNDEIGQLETGFNFMLEEIDTLIDEAYRSRVIQKEAELKALQAQINPHFLYNSLSLINWKAIKIKAADISHITTVLAKFYRTSLNKGQNNITIWDEIENTKAYIEIQLIRHDYNFDVIYELEEEIFNYHMINLIVQPIVENAIEHGLDNKKDGRGQLKITGRVSGTYIELGIDDNGYGMDEEAVSQVFINQSKGYGLKNVQDRIKLFFGEEYGITIRSQLDSGTYVSIKIPKYIKEA